MCDQALKGIGIDLCEIARMQTMLDENRSLRRMFTEAEEAYIRAFPVNLDPKADYEDTVSGRTYNGSMAMRLGLPIDWKNGDHFSQMWHFVKK